MNCTPENACTPECACKLAAAEQCACTGSPVGEGGCECKPAIAGKIGEAAPAAKAAIDPMDAAKEVFAMALKNGIISNFDLSMAKSPTQLMTTITERIERANRKNSKTPAKIWKKR